MAGNRGYREFTIANRTFSEQQDEQARSITSASVAGMNIRTQSDLLTGVSGSKLPDFTTVGVMQTVPTFEQLFPRMLGVNHQLLCTKQVRVTESLHALNTKFYSAGKYEDPRIIIPSATAAGREAHEVRSVTAAGVITTLADPHNLTVGELVYFNTDLDITTGLGIPLQGNYWYVYTTPGTATFTVSQTPGTSGGIVAAPTRPDDAGTFVVFDQTQSPAPRVVFNNCVFVREAEHGTRPFIRIVDGARTVFVGCYFIGLSGPPENTVEQGMVRVDSGFGRDV